MRINRHFTLDHYPDYLSPQRFIKAFRKVWQRLPLSARRRIASYWRKESGLLMIVDELDDKALNQIDPAGIVGRRDLEFLDACLLLPDVALEFTIAHELAHVYQYSIGGVPDEDEANEMVRDWFELEDDSDYWKKEGMVWFRYVVKMFNDIRGDTRAEIRAGMG